MAKKEIFIAEIEKAFNEIPQFTLSDDALTYFEALKAGVSEKVKPAFTENGRLVLQFMKDNKDNFNNMFRAKDCEGAGVTSKTASGAMRKLVTDGYVEKLGANPVVYSLTSKGIEVDLSAE